EVQRDGGGASHPGGSQQQGQTEGGTITFHPVIRLLAQWMGRNAGPKLAPVVRPRPPAAPVGSFASLLPLRAPISSLLAEGGWDCGSAQRVSSRLPLVAGVGTKVRMSEAAARPRHADFRPHSGKLSTARSAKWTRRWTKNSRRKLGVQLPPGVEAS